jgi:hypothetical protein
MFSIGMLFYLSHQIILLLIAIIKGTTYKISANEYLYFIMPVLGATFYIIDSIDLLKKLENNKDKLLVLLKLYYIDCSNEKLSKLNVFSRYFYYDIIFYLYIYSLKLSKEGNSIFNTNVYKDNSDFQNTFTQLLGQNFFELTKSDNKTINYLASIVKIKQSTIEKNINFKTYTSDILNINIKTSQLLAFRQGNIDQPHNSVFKVNERIQHFIYKLISIIAKIIAFIIVITPDSIISKIVFGAITFFSFTPQFDNFLKEKIFGSNKQNK